MSDSHSHHRDRAGCFAYPILAFVASRALIITFALSAPLFGGALGSEQGLSAVFTHKHPMWSALAHGEIAGYARVARAGWSAAADASYFPVVPLLGRWLGALAGSVEMGLVLLSLVTGALGFWAVYGLFACLRGRETARWALALLAAFPFSYHLTDGSALGCVLACSAWGSWLALRGAFARASILLSLGVLTHPAGIFSAVAVACLPASHATHRWPKLVVVLLPGMILLAWPLYLGQHLHLGTSALWGTLVPRPAPSTFAWSATLASFGGLAALGVLLLVWRRGLRLLALAGAVQQLLAQPAQAPVALGQGQLGG